MCRYSYDVEPLTDCEPGGYALDALNMGLKIGFIGSSDGHGCMPGNDLWGKYINGLVAVLVKENTRGAILDAIRARRCYATTNERILADFDINGNIMGSDIYIAEGSVLNINVSVFATGDIEYATVIKNGDILHCVKDCGSAAVFSVKDRATANHVIGHNYYYVRVKQKNGYTYSL